MKYNIIGAESLRLPHLGWVFHDTAGALPPWYSSRSSTESTFPGI